MFLDTSFPMNNTENIEVTTPLAGSSSHVPHGDSFFVDFLSPQQQIFTTALSSCLPSLHIRLYSPLINAEEDAE